MSKKQCTVTPDWQGTQAGYAFSSLDKIFNLTGQVITRDGMSDVILLTIDGTRFYVKRYTSGGRHLRRYVGRSRIKGEWENLLYFHQLGIPSAEVVAYGEERSLVSFTRGAMVTREVEETTDLAKLVKSSSPLFKQPQWVEQVIAQVAKYTAMLHIRRFVHTDLKWRNILVTTDQQPVIYFIDCPSGVIWPTYFFGTMVNRGINKDLACLDKHAKKVLSNTQRLRFYLRYKGIKKLQPDHKVQIKQVLAFFEGRE